MFVFSLQHREMMLRCLQARVREAKGRIKKDGLGEARTQGELAKSARSQPIMYILQHITTTSTLFLACHLKFVDAIQQAISRSLSSNLNT